MKKEKGSVTLFVLIACMFMIVILLIVNIGITNKNRSEEKKIEEITKQYNQNEVDLDNVYKETEEKQEYVTKDELEEILNDKVEEIKEDKVYKPGDILTMSFHTSGFVTASATNYYCTIYLGKIINSSVQSISVEGITNLVIRQNDNYLLGEAFTNTTTGFTLTALWFDKSANNVILKIEVPTKNSKTVNNDAVGIAMIGLKLKFN